MQEPFLTISKTLRIEIWVYDGFGFDFFCQTNPLIYRM